MKKGDLVKWTFLYESFKASTGSSQFGILVKEQDLPLGSWIVLLQCGSLMHADISELVLINEV